MNGKTAEINLSNSAAEVQARAKWPSITVLCLCEVLTMTLWFSATAVVPAFLASGKTTEFWAGLFTSGVQLGFVIGTFISAVFGLSDRYDPRRLFLVCALSAAAANGCIVFFDPSSAFAPLLRVVTGAFLAGIYPVGMKMAASWAKGDMGLIVGLLVGALTLGSASPHLLNALGGWAWQSTLLASSVLAVGGAFLIMTIQLGPNWKRSARLRPDCALEAWRNRSIRFVNFGYFGHMWELYGMWTWIGTFLSTGFALTIGKSAANQAAGYATFVTIASGFAGCLVAGLLADRIGRVRVASAALFISGACSLCVGFFYGKGVWAMLAVCIVWSIAAIADSAQFSAKIAELSEPSVVGTMLTIQTCVGFIVTLFTIHLIPVLASSIGWRYAFAPLALGPLFGILALRKVREPR